MSKRNYLITALAVMAIFSVVFAGEWQTILEKIKAKYDGYQEKIEDITMVMVTKMNTKKGEVSAEYTTYKKGDKFRSETSMEVPDMPEEMKGMKMIVIYDGKDTWMISPFMGKKRKLPEDKSTHYKRQADWWNWLSEKGKVIGSDKIDDIDCYIVQLDIEDAPYSKLWVSKDEYQVLKAEYSEGKEHIGVILFSDYKNIADKYPMPHKMEILIDGEVASTMLIKSIEINKGLSDDLFDPDKVKVKGGLQQMMQQMMKQHQGK